MRIIIVMLFVLVASTAHAQNKPRGVGDWIRAARMLGEWRYDEARVLIASLAARAPDRAETRYLQAELAFIEGNYPRAIELLDGLRDDTDTGNVAQLRELAASTYQVTKDFVFRESSGGHFVIYYPPGKDEVIVDLTGEVLEAAYAAFGEDLGWRPSEKIRVELLARPSDLAQLSPLTEADIETTGTIALCKYGKLMVVSPRATLFGYPWMDTLVHEYLHYVVSQMSHDRVPVWFHEGLARMQQTRWREALSDRLSEPDEHLLATALQSRKLITFDEMHPSMAKLPSQQAAALAYAEVFTMMTYLHGKIGYSGLRRIIELQRDGKSARRAVSEVVAEPWEAVERDWKRYLRGRGLRPSRTYAARAQQDRIRFDKGGKEDENVGVEEIGSDKGRNFARLGGILRARGLSQAAAVEYEKALAIVGAGDPFVAAKLSRTYLELKKYPRAIELARPLAEADEHDAAPYTTLGIAYMATDDPVAAREAFEVALRVSPFDPSVRCGLAEAYARTDEPALAKREQQACKQLRQ